MIELTYKVPLSEIDACMKAHMDFVREHYAAKRFLISGRKVPREGGIILARGGSREEIEAIAKGDPFVTRGLADVRIVEFQQSQRAEDLEALLGPRR